MTTTIQDPKQNGHPSRRLRLNSMEVLGFFDTPATASTTWTTTPPVAPSPTPTPRTDSVVAERSDPFLDWQPNEVLSKLVQGPSVWRRAVAVVLIGIALGVFAFWLYQRPVTIANQARAAAEAVADEAVVLRTDLAALSELNSQLATGISDPSALNDQLLTLDGHARDLFEASAALNNSETTTRSQAADAASAALDASRLVSEAYAYRAAVIPILAAPEFETDPALISLEEAARQFSEWQTHFDSVRSALPPGTLSAVGNELEIIAGDLQPVQSSYLDALRNEDRSATMTAMARLSGQLEDAESTLMDSLAEVQATVEDRIGEASDAIDSLVG